MSMLEPCGCAKCSERDGLEQDFDARPVVVCPKCGALDVHAEWHGEGADHRSRAHQPCRKYGEDAGLPAEEHLHYTCRYCHFSWTDDVLTPTGGERA